MYGSQKCIELKEKEEEKMNKYQDALDTIKNITYVPDNGIEQDSIGYWYDEDIGILQELIDSKTSEISREIKLNKEQCSRALRRLKMNKYTKSIADSTVGIRQKGYDVELLDKLINDYFDSYTQQYPKEREG